MSTLVKRTLSGAVYVAVIVGTILAPDSSLFALVATVMTALGIREFMHLTGKDKWLTIMSCVAGVSLVLSVWMIVYLCNAPHTYDPDGLSVSRHDWIPDWLMGLTLLVFVLSTFVTLIAELFRKEETPVMNWGRYWQALMMTALPFACMSVLCELNQYYLLCLFISIWVNDTGAYLVGMGTSHLPGGNHKMFVRVSPKKSWEGLIGGIVFNLAAGYVFYRVGWIDRLWLAMAFVLIVSMSGTLGDLMESLLKRSVGVKDSGRFMPGHGGVLDRFDSMLLATPVICLFLLIEVILSA